MADPFFPPKPVLLILHAIWSAEFAASIICPTRVLLTDSEVIDNAAMLRWGGVAEGNVADELEGLVNDAVAERLCLDPRTPPSTAARMAINPTNPPNSIHFLLEGRWAYT